MSEYQACPTPHTLVSLKVGTMGTAKPSNMGTDGTEELSNVATIKNMGTAKPSNMGTDCYRKAQ